MTSIIRTCNKWIKQISLSFIIYHLAFSQAVAQTAAWQTYMSYAEPQQIVKVGNLLFVRASNDLYNYNLNDHSITTFDKVNALSDTYVTHIAWNAAAGRLAIIYKNSNIDLMDSNGNVTNISALYAKSMTQDKTVNSLYSNDIFTYLATGFGVMKVNMQRAEVAETYILNENITHVGISQNTLFAKTAGGKVFSGDMNKNLIDSKNWQPATAPDGIFDEDTSDWDNYINTVKTLQPGGPKYNFFGFLKINNGQLYTCGGGYSVVQDLQRPAALQRMDGQKDWTWYPENMEERTGHYYRDLNCLVIDPKNEKHLFASGRTGLYEFNDTALINHYNLHNSPMKPVIADNKNYVILQGICFDSQGSLWCLNGYHKDVNILELKPDGQWTSHYQDVLNVDNEPLPNLTKPFFDSRGLLWFLNDSHIHPSVCCYNPQTDKAWRMGDIVNQDGVKTVVEYIHAIVEDKERNIWVGTNKGLFVVYESDMANLPDITFNQVKVPRNDGTNYADYLLNGVDISDIFIDGGNRKWVVTNGNGAYLISADNMVQLQHFTTDNSLLLSNNIESVAVDPRTGEVFFGTENGLCSYMGDATETTMEATDNDDIYAYPNPASHYEGLITIHGLSFDADVKIVTSSGKLVAQGRSNGGTFTWDGRDQQGRRVASGVYTALSTTHDGKKSGVCRIAVIN